MVLHYTFVGEMYSVIAHSVCEGEQASESYIVSTAASLWILRENCDLF